MKYPIYKHVGIFSAFFFICTAALAKHNSDHPLSPEDWNEVKGKVELLEAAGLMPTLLPVILSNRDALQLTDKQRNGPLFLDSRLSVFCPYMQRPDHAATGHVTRPSYT